MAKQLLLISTFPERNHFIFKLSKKSLDNKNPFFQVKSNNSLLKNFKLTTCNEDFELKKLLFNFTVIISKNATALQV
jgi:hypothetical protein